MKPREWLLLHGLKMKSRSTWRQEVGTQKVITEHSTIGLVITTDGSISDIPRSEYEEAEERVINELKDISKPFIILLNCVNPNSAASKTLAEGMSEKYGVPVMAVSCVDLTESDIRNILTKVLFEFPIKEISVDMPKWITALEKGHWLKESVYDSVKKPPAASTISARSIALPRISASVSM